MNKGNSTHMRSLSAHRVSDHHQIIDLRCLLNSEEPKTSFGFSLIAFYIFDHGFGHAARNISIIGYILEANLDIIVIVKTGKHQENCMCMGER